MENMTQLLDLIKAVPAFSSMGTFGMVLVSIIIALFVFSAVYSKIKGLKSKEEKRAINEKEVKTKVDKENTDINNKGKDDRGDIDNMV